jgi:hypothetical protein
MMSGAFPFLEPEPCTATRETISRAHLWADVQAGPCRH